MNGLVEKINAEVIRRITESALRMTLVSAPEAPVVTGLGPVGAPSSPLTGPSATPTVTWADPTPERPTEIIKCLWFDIASSELGDGTGLEAIKFRQLGWVAQATALARVLVSEAALDITNPYVGTKFDRIDYVVYQTRRFRVLQVVPFGSSGSIPVTYYVWLVGDK